MPAVRDPLTPFHSSVNLGEPQPTKVLTPAQGAGLNSMPWRLVAVLSQKTLDVYYTAGGGCTHPVGFQVSESASSVEVWALSRTNGDHACSDELRVGRTTLSLRAPLGNRALLHGPVDPAWAHSLQ
ncbi:hypothetical protein SAMN05444157_3432 [Frankineae bacterium MT45]|nr:hypothetical protein SAMN05444157_3432 [Frankineae bacterium MT45]